MNTFRFSGIVLTAVAVLLSVVPAPAATAETRSSALALVVWGPGDTLNGARLRCEPPGGSHPDPLTACAELIAVDGDFDQLGEPAICTTEYRPVYAAAAGYWRDRPVFWQRRFDNPCHLHAETGTVFRI